MSITVTREQSRVPVTVLKISGAIHLGNSEDLQNQGAAAFAQGERDLVIDLSQVDRITSAGLRAILYLTKLFNHIEGDTQLARSTHLKLASPNANVRQVLKISGFDVFMDIFDNTPDAIASF